MNACWSGWSLPLARQPLDRRDLLALDVGERGPAGPDGLPVDDHRAGPAEPDAAAVLRAGEPEVGAEGPEERALSSVSRVVGRPFRRKRMDSFMGSPPRRRSRNQGDYPPGRPPVRLFSGGGPPDPAGGAYPPAREPGAASARGPGPAPPPGLRRDRGHEPVDESPGGTGHGLDRLVESHGVRLRGTREAGDLADVLQGGGPRLLLGRGRHEVVERPYAAAHARW